MLFLASFLLHFLVRHGRVLKLAYLGPLRTMAVSEHATFVHLLVFALTIPNYIEANLLAKMKLANKRVFFASGLLFSGEFIHPIV